jgi:hypothetical protein
MAAATLRGVRLELRSDGALLLVVLLPLVVVIIVIGAGHEGEGERNAEQRQQGSLEHVGSP